MSDTKLQPLPRLSTASFNILSVFTKKRRFKGYLIRMVMINEAKYLLKNSLKL